MALSNYSRASKALLNRYGGVIDSSMFPDKATRNLKYDWDKDKPAALNEIDETTLKVARQAFRCLKNGNIARASGLLNGKRQQVVELLSRSDNPSVKAFLNNITVHAKRHCQNVENEAKFIIKLLQQARLHKQIAEIRMSPHDNIAAIAARY